MSDNQSLSFQTFLRGMSPSAFKTLGMNELAYIRVNNDNGFSIHSADGNILAKCSSFKNAITATHENDLKAVTLH